jgi:hypothetical protein
MASAYHWMQRARPARRRRGCRDRLAHVERLEQRQLLAVRAHQLGELRSSTRLRSPARGATSSPRSKPRGAGHGEVHIRRIPGGNLRDHAPVDGTDAVEGGARGAARKRPSMNATARRKRGGTGMPVGLHVICLPRRQRAAH